jgi:outer membrane protein assembly factor BamA
MLRRPSRQPRCFASFLALLLIILPTLSRSASDAGDGAERVLRVEAVEIQGAGKTRDAVILQLLDLEPGDAVDAGVLAAKRRRLIASGYFEEVELSSRPGAARGGVVLVLRVRERHRPYFDTGFGFRDPEGWYLTLLGLRAENPLGRGGRATAGLRLGFRTWGAEGELYLPLRADRSLALRLRLRAYEEQTLWYEPEIGWRGLYDEYRLGLQRRSGELALIWDPPPPLRVELGLAGRTTDPLDEARNRDQDRPVPFSSLPPALATEGEALALNAYQASLLIGAGGMNGRPGRSLLLSARFVDSSLGADRSYARWSAVLRSVTSLGRGRSLAFKLQGGIIGEDAPWYERFRLGGSYSLRGFRDQSLSPPPGHTRFWSAMAEYRFPMIREAEGGPTRLAGLLFLDAGQGGLADPDRDALAPAVDYEAVQIGAGYGIRWRLPWIGILGFDVGAPVTAGITGENLWYYLTLGHSF